MKCRTMAYIPLILTENNDMMLLSLTPEQYLPIWFLVNQRRLTPDREGVD